MTPAFVDRAAVRGWARVLRHRLPRLASAAETAIAARSGRAGLAAQLQIARARIHVLERDHRLLAAHVAALTERLEQVAAAGGQPLSARPRDEALAAVRLSAIAFYEHRITRLERHLKRQRRHERSVARAPGHAVGPEPVRTSGEHPGAA